MDYAIDELMDELKKTAHNDKLYERFTADNIIKKHFFKLQQKADTANDRVELVKKLINDILTNPKLNRTKRYGKY